MGLFWFPTFYSDFNHGFDYNSEFFRGGSWLKLNLYHLTSNGTKYSGMDQEKFVVDSLVCLSRPYLFKFFKVFYKFYLVHFWYFVLHIFPLWGFYGIHLLHILIFEILSIDKTVIVIRFLLFKGVVYWDWMHFI